MKRLLYLTIYLPLAWLTACDVHEFPDDPGTSSTMEVRIMADINFLTPFEDVHEITQQDREAIGGIVHKNEKLAVVADTIRNQAQENQNIARQLAEIVDQFEM